MQEAPPAAKPPGKTERLPTGIKGFDELVEGGLVQGSTTALVGGTGVGKSIFGLQFIYAGAKKGEPGVYITFEQDADSLRSSAARFGMDLTKVEENGMLTIAEADPSKVLNLVKEGYGQIVEDIVKKKAVRVVVDSLSAFESMVQDDFERRRTIVGLSKWLNDHGCTTVMLAEAEETITITDKGEPEVARETDVAESVADGAIVIYDVLTGNVRSKALEVVKMRNTEITPKICPMEFGKDGIVVCPKHKISK
jgi:circadian clock protein KaiC